MTRDSIVWLFGVIGGIAVFLGGHFGLLQEAFPGITEVWQARIELTSGLMATLSALFRMSPLALNPDNKMAIQPTQTLGIHRTEPPST